MDRNDNHRGSIAGLLTGGSSYFWNKNLARFLIALKKVAEIPCVSGSNSVLIWHAWKSDDD